MTPTYEIETSADGFAIIAIDEDGERFDMNDGEPCLTVQELRLFVSQLSAQGAFDDDDARWSEETEGVTNATEQALLDACDAL